jgi:hypothetical protein
VSNNLTVFGSDPVKALLAIAKLDHAGRLEPDQIEFLGVALLPGPFECTLRSQHRNRLRIHEVYGPGRIPGSPERRNPSSLSRARGNVPEPQALEEVAGEQTAVGGEGHVLVQDA